MLFILSLTTYLTTSMLLLIISITSTLNVEVRFLYSRIDQQTNTIILGGFESYSFYLSNNGNQYNLSKFQCLDLPSYTIDSYNSPTINQIGLLAKQSYTFIRIDKWIATLFGAIDKGFSIVGPLQRVIIEKYNN